MQVSAYRKGTMLGDLKGLEDSIPDQQTVVGGSDSGFVWFVVKATVQPDPDLSRRSFWNGGGELHQVRLSSHGDLGLHYSAAHAALRCEQVWTPALASAMVSDRTRAAWLQDARTWLSW
jgi:hypothetical protein